MRSGTKVKLLKSGMLYIGAANDGQLSLNHMLALCNSLKRRIVVYVS